MARPTDLTDELTLQIRKFVLEGQSYKNIQQILEIPDGTWDAWVYKDHKDFRKMLTDWKHERMIKKAELNVEVLQESEDEKVALQANTFVLETLGKKNYSKRSEMTGADGKDLVVQVVQYGDNTTTS